MYVVTRNHYAEGYSHSIPTPRFGDLIMIQVYSPERARKTDPYASGQSYALYRGGEPAGHVRIDKVGPLQCDGSAAMVSLEHSSEFPTQSFALATNANAVRWHTNSQRPANAQERLVGEQLAAKQFRKNGVPDAAVGSTQFDNLISTPVDASSRRVLIGLARIKTRTVWHELFLIADVAGSRVELFRYRQVMDVEDGKDSQPLRFADQLDLDGDGSDELVIEVTGYESEEFWIYKHQNSSWQRVWVGGQGGC